MKTFVKIVAEIVAVALVYVGVRYETVGVFTGIILGLVVIRLAGVINKDRSVYAQEGVSGNTSSADWLEVAVLMLFALGAYLYNIR